MSSDADEGMVAVATTADKRPVDRTEQRARRANIFKVWSKGGSFTDVGKLFGLTRGRTHQIIWKAVVSDGLRSKRARVWLAELDPSGYWLGRYDDKFRKPSKGRGGRPRQVSVQPKPH